MNAIADQLSVFDRLPAILQTARHRAAERRAPVLVSVSQRLEQDIGEVTLGGGQEYFLWQQPSRDLSLVAFGQAVRLTSTGDERFLSVRSQLTGLVSDALIETNDALLAPAPLCFAGFAFDTTRPMDELWQPFPQALAVVPRLLLARTADASSLTLNLLLEAEADLPAAIEALRAQLALAFADTAPFPETAAIAQETDAERMHWDDSVRALTARIAEGAAEKVVLARRLQVTSTQPFDVASALDRLRTRYPDCTVFAAGTADVCFLGATPETLVRLHGRQVSLDCLAGSARRGRDEAEDRALAEALLADDKERREHAVVTRGLTEALQDVCHDLDLPSTPGLRRTANVQHLHTPIRATTDSDCHVLDLVERLHPTPATAGLPRQKSLCLIREHEAFSRGWYAGPVGWIDAEGGGEFAVALRSGLVRGDSAYLYAGCGIVTGSDPQREYDESRLKLQAMLWALNATP